VILYIAITMLIPEKDDERRGRRASDRLVSAIVAIFVADVTMSVDNVLAIGALARGNLPVLIFGLVVSVALLLLASALIARIIERFWWLMDLTALLLAYLAAQLVLSDPIVSRMAELTGWKAAALTVGAVAIVFVTAIVLRVSQRRARARRARTSDKEPQPDNENEVAP
jgi:predicted tellurium resistance membrane protein TerC